MGMYVAIGGVEVFGPWRVEERVLRAVVMVLARVVLPFVIR